MASSDFEQARRDSERVDRLIGEVLANRYQIEARLGEGAMGSVYRAKHVKVGRPFAVKVLHPRLLEDEKTLQRFEREAELAGRLHHPNVIGVVDVGETSDGLRYMVMDFAEGHDLATLLSEAPMPPARIHTLTRQILEGLYHAHEAGLIHRDLKPENVIVEKDSHGEEVPRIVDFGIAILREGGAPSDGTGRLTTNGLVLGTPHYMAPEQAVNDPIDHRIDLFALGIMIYELLCGKLPFDGHGAEVARANLMLDPPPIAERVPYLEVDPLLEAFARRLMEKRRDARPPTAKAARELLDLIKTDRDAAAVQLGVPLAIAVRAPKSTEPVTPRHVGEFSGTFPPPFREAEPALQAPAMSSAVAVRDERLPLITEEAAPPPRRRIGLYAAIGAMVLVLVIGIAAVATRAKSGEGSAKAIDRSPAPAGPVAVVEPPKPAPVEPPTPSAMVAPPVALPVAPPVAPKLDKRSTSKHPVIEKHPVARPKLETVEQVPQTRPVPVETKVPPPAASYDANAFRAQWIGIGQELKAVAAAKGLESVSDLQTRYSHIFYVDANSSQAHRDAAKLELDAIHAALRARK
ncbi:MAG: serine/threonine-protein kinase [Kofleriaceae bacterium]